MTAFDGWTPEQIEEGSVRELTAGRLPIRAQQRLATMRADQAFTSDLTVDEHHAIRSVGFAPVGQVMGSCVYHLGYLGSWNCNYYQGVSGSFLGSSRPDLYRQRRLATDMVMPAVTEADQLRDSLYDARMLAVNRMRQECAGLGGDGVVAVRLTIEPFPAGGFEFKAIGTAIRAAGDVRPRQPFMSDLSGQDFAKLITAGWVPCGFILGVAAVVRHDDYRTQVQARSWSNNEVTGYTELVHTARHLARKRLRADCARSGGAGVVVQSMFLQVREQRCGYGSGEQHDHLAEAMVIGTAITPFQHAGGNAPPAPLPIMRLR